jgi:hypothetical protein
MAASKSNVYLTNRVRAFRLKTAEFNGKRPLLPQNAYVLGGALSEDSLKHTKTKSKGRIKLSFPTLAKIVSGSPFGP